MNPETPSGWCIIPPDLVRGPESDVLPAAGEANWGIALLDVDRLRARAGDRLPPVGVLDTGIDHTHPDLAHCPPGRDFTGSSSGGRDRNGHGSHCSGTVGGRSPSIGVAPGCRVIHAKVLSDGGSGSGSWIADGIRYCVDQGCGVLSMSLGSSSPDGRIIRAMEAAAKAGVWIVAAAGNSGPNTPDVDWPGRSAHCLSVAALNADLSPASFSSSGQKIDTSAPGVGIWSARPGGGYQRMSGTSMATPFVSGLLVLLRAALVEARRPLPDVYALRELLRAAATDTHTPGIDRRTGPGWLGGVLLELLAVPDPPPVARS